MLLLLFQGCSGIELKINYNCFLPFIIVIRSLYNGRQFLNYKSSVEVSDTGRIHTAEGETRMSTCDVFYRNGNITCGADFFFSLWFSVNPASISSIQTNIKGGPSLQGGDKCIALIVGFNGI